MEKIADFSEEVVVNAGPLIGLASIGEFRLLKDLFGEIVIPSAVYNEVVIHRARISQVLKKQGKLIG